MRGRRRKLTATARASTRVSHNRDGIRDECKAFLDALLVFRESQPQCRDGCCSCLDLQACLQRLMEKAAQQQPGLDAFIVHRLHLLLPIDCMEVAGCSYAADAQLALADAFYKLIAVPEYRRRQAAAAALPPAAPGGLEADDNCSPIELITYSYEPPECPETYAQDLSSQWVKVLQRLHKAEEALPSSTLPLSPANASKLSKWICERPKGIDSKLDGLLQPSHTMILWAAAACRISTENIFTRRLAAGCSRQAGEVVLAAAALAAALLDVTSTMGRLAAAGISFNTQPSPAAVAAALDLAAQVTAALSPYLYERLRMAKEFFAKHQQQQHQQQQPGAQPPLLLLPLYLTPLQQRQQQESEHSLVHLRRLGQVDPQGDVPLLADLAITESQLYWSLGVPVICFHGSQLLQKWEQQLQQQLQWEQQLQQQLQEGGVPPRPAAAAAAAAGCGGGGGGGGASSGGLEGGDSSSSSSSSSSSRPAWQEAERMLLLGAAALEGRYHQQQQQQLQQQLALCRQYQQQFQQAAAKLGLSSELMAAVAAWFTEAEQYSSICGSSSGGAAAGSSAAADCLSTVCAALLLLTNLYGSIDPATRSRSEAEQKLRRLTAAEELLVADFILKAPGLLSATATAAFCMAAQQDSAAAVAGGVGTGSVLPQLPLVAHLLQLFHKIWPPLSRLLCGQLSPAEHAAWEGAGPVWQQHQRLQQRLLQQLQKEGLFNEPPEDVRAAAGLVLLGNNSILLQQLLRTAAAAEAAGNHQQQQQLLSAAVLYCADSLGELMGGLWADLWLVGPEQLATADLVPWEKQGRVVALAVQAFEAAVRHLLGAVPGPTAAAGSTAPATGSGGNGSSSSRGGAGGSSKPAVPPSITKVELAAVQIFTATMKYASKADSSSSRSVTRLHRTEYELLQAALSMLLTSAKLWQAGLQPPLPVELLWKIVTPASACVQLAEMLDSSTPGGPAAAAAAAAEAAGGVQVCHLVSRYLSCVEQQLRERVASGDAQCESVSLWLAAFTDQDMTPLPQDARSLLAAAGRPPPTRLQAIVSTVKETSEIAWAVGSSRGPLARLCVQHEGDRVEACFKATYPTLVEVLGCLKPEMLGEQLARREGSKSPRRRREELKGLRLALLGEADVLANALLGFGCVLAATLPSRFGCNWPGCVRLSGVSEGYGLVRGHGCVCGGCRQARYCSVACQAAHWPAHKAFCQKQQQQQQQQGGAVAVSLAATAAATIKT